MVYNHPEILLKIGQFSRENDQALKPGDIRRIPLDVYIYMMQCCLAPLPAKVIVSPHPLVRAVVVGGSRW